MTAPFCPTTGKIAYPTRPAAAKARDEIMRRDRTRMTSNVFKCPKCGLFHIGRARIIGKELPK